MFSELMLAAILAFALGYKANDRSETDPIIYDIFEQSRDRFLKGPIPQDKETIIGHINSLEYSIDEYSHRLQYYWEQLVMPHMKDEYLSVDGENNLNFYVKCRRGLNRMRYRLIILNKELEKYENSAERTKPLLTSTSNNDILSGV